MVVGIAHTFKGFSLLDPVFSRWCVKLKQYLMKFWVNGFMLETIYLCGLKILKEEEKIFDGSSYQGW